MLGFLDSCVLLLLVCFLIIHTYGMSPFAGFSFWEVSEKATLSFEISFS